ncbi:MAG: glycosyltransferase family 4 protein [Candidatus Omnitrophica bacterium]|nr:glycosyltransferase family 4 protein [Candidatus Omnitrophota bacterium]
MKVLIIHNHYLEKGGEDEVFSAEAKVLEERGHKVIRYEKSNEYIKSLPFFRKVIFILLRLNFSRVVYKEIKEIIKKEKPDIAHIHNIFFYITPAVYYALKEEDIPVVQSLHNYRFFCLKGIFFRKGKVCERCKDKRFFHAVVGRCWNSSFILSFFLAKLIFKRNPFFKNADSYIATSRFSRNKFIEFGLEEQRMHLKPNFLTIEPESGSQEHNYALFIGRLVDYKGVETLMGAYNLNPAFNLKIIGDGPLKERVYDFSSSYDNVEFLGKIDRDLLLKTIRGASFIIFPSECYENMPLVIMESFALSKPVLASNLGAIKEFVIDGFSGVLFEPGNINDLAAKITYLFFHNKERMEMGKNANKIYRDQFNEEKNYYDLINIYEKTIKFKKIVVTRINN